MSRKTCTLTAVSTDPDDDDIRYVIEWGDGNSFTTDLKPSGEQISEDHDYEDQGSYTISVKAVDQYEAESPVATTTVTKTKDSKISQSISMIKQKTQMLTFNPTNLVKPQNLIVKPINNIILPITSTNVIQLNIQPIQLNQDINIMPVVFTQNPFIQITPVNVNPVIIPESSEDEDDSQSDLLSIDSIIQSLQNQLNISIQ